VGSAVGAAPPVCAMTVGAMDLDLPALGSAVATGRLDPREIVGAALARLESVEPVVRAWVTVDGPGAEAQADALVRRLRGGGAAGPLAGALVGIKDVIDVAGLPTGNGSRLSARTPATTDAPVVARLRAADAIILGKTTTTEFATGVVGRPTRNPWRSDRMAGGSSSGSAAAPASGTCHAALGTDTAGSIRIPAALCGVVGLRPRRHRLPGAGITPLAWSFDSCGPLARSVADVAQVWHALSGDPAVGTATALRVGMSPRLEAHVDGLDTEVAAAVRAGAALLAGTTQALVDVDLSPVATHASDRGIRLLAEAAAVHRELGLFPARADEYEPATRRQLETGAGVTAAQLLDADRRLTEGLEVEYRRALERADVLVLPTVPMPAPRLLGDGGRQPAGNSGLTRLLTSLCGPASWCDVASISVPCGLNRDGLPIGLQIIGGDEATVLAAALRYEALAGPPKIATVPQPTEVPTPS